MEYAYWAVKCNADVIRDGKTQRCDTPLRLKNIHDCDPIRVDPVLIGQKPTFEQRCGVCQQLRNYAWDDLGVILSPTELPEVS